MRKKIPVTLLVLALLLAFAALPAYAATGTVTTQTTTNIFDAYNATTGKWNELKTAQHRLGSYIVYCLQHKKSSPNSEVYNLNDLYDNYSDRTKRGLQIIVTNGYPFETGGLSRAHAEYATANAVRFWLSECGDSQFYNMTNLRGFSDAQLRTLAASGVITDKIRVRDAQYIPALQFSIELLIKARAQEVIQHVVSIGASASSVSAELSGDVFSGSTTVSIENLRGGYTIDASELPAGSEIIGYTGVDSEDISITIPANEENANKTYTLTVSGLDDRCRANISAIGHNTNNEFQRVMVVHVGTSFFTQVVEASFTVTTGDMVTERPDLVIAEIKTNKSSYTTREVITAMVKVKNDSEVDCEGFYTSLTDSTGVASKAYSTGLRAGATTTLTWTWTAPDTPCTLTLTAFADCDGNITESNEENNTAETSVSIVEPVYPDLVVTELKANRTSYTTGDSMTVTAKVMNNSETDCGSFHTSLTDSTGASSKLYSSGLEAGATTTLTWTWTAPSTPCTLTLTAFADCDRVIRESNENNNTQSTTVSVTKPTFPDLTVTSVEASEPSYTAGTTVTVFSTIANAGDRDAGTFVVSFTPEGLTSQAQGQTQTQTVTGLRAGASTRLRWSFSAPVLTQTQQVEVVVEADATGVIEESDETNNTGTGQVTIIGEKPDLLIDSLTPDASSYLPNERVTITAVVRNNAVVPCPASKLRLSGDGISTQTKDVPALNRASTATVTFSFSAPYAIDRKTFDILAVVDPDNQIDEYNETNNRRNGGFVVNNPLPDLTVARIRANKDEYAEGEAGRVTVTVVNQGSKTVDSSKLRLTLGDIFSETKTTGMIAAGSAAQVTFDFVAPETLERMTVTATATTDPLDEILESNEHNNTLTSTLAVRPVPPDLAVIDTNATNWYAGKEVVVTATVVNYTQRDVPEVTIRLTIGGQRYEEVIPVPGNGTNLAVYRITTPTTTGSTTLSFVADPYNAIPEENRDNNDLNRTIEIVEVPAGVVLDPDMPELEDSFKSNGLFSLPRTSNSDYHIWQEVRLEDGAYVTRTYWAQLQTAFALTPDPRIAYEAEPSRMESGFGAQVALQTQLTTNYDHPEKLVGVQMVWTFSPETGYGGISEWSSVFDALEATTGAAGDKNILWQYAVNPWSESNSRLHYTPLWFPDGQYTVLSQAFYAWSPAGQMYWYDAGSVDIQGDMYDRVTAIQGR